MVDGPRFLIGYGERLTKPVSPPGGGGPKPAPYTKGVARERLAPMVTRAVAAAQTLPKEACPDDRVVSALTLHPSFVAKSYFPTALLRELGFTPVGSKPVQVIPDLVAKKSKDSDEIERTPGESLKPSTQLFVASTRERLKNWSSLLDESMPLTRLPDEITRVEAFELPSPDQRLKISGDIPSRVNLEVVLHATGTSGDQSILRAFENYAESLGAAPESKRRIDVGTLSFIPVAVDRDQLEPLARFSFLRVARLVPRLRPLSPSVVIFRGAATETVTLPTAPAVDPDLRIAVFDGGLPENTSLSPWAQGFTPDDISGPLQDGLFHGHAVTSALLFGAIEPGKNLNQPFAHVDHYRVLDDNLDQDPNSDELFDVIKRIESVLTKNPYEFINLSIGPDLPIEDDDVHAWTAFFDNHLSKGTTILTAAVGNNGELDRLSGIARIQVPSDSVNAIAVGAADSRDTDWRRANYSAIGPGRSPGLVKPDLVAFGGTIFSPFVVVDPEGNLLGVTGTSFAAPLVLRTASGIRAVFGDRVSPLAIRALLVHSAEMGENSADTWPEVGWGRVPQDLERIVTCPAGTARVMYQGKLQPGKYLRAQLPLPIDELSGKVNITATLVYSTNVDAADPSNYTRSGVEVVFRPHEGKFDTPKSTNAKSAPFFRAAGAIDELERRSDAKKWETVLHAKMTKMADSLHRPVFDIHYNAREEGHVTNTRETMSYAMVITLESKSTPDLYDRVLQTYATQLEEIRPRIDVQVRLPAV